MIYWEIPREGHTTEGLQTEDWKKLLYYIQQIGT